MLLGQNIIFNYLIDNRNFRLSLKIDLLYCWVHEELKIKSA